MTSHLISAQESMLFRYWRQLHKQAASEGVNDPPEHIKGGNTESGDVSGAGIH